MPRRPLVLPLLLAAALGIGACAGAGAGEVPGSSTSSSTTSEPPTTTTSTTAPRAAPIRVLVVGDSLMDQLGKALVQWSERNPGRLEIVTKAHVGCGTTRGGLKRYAAGTGSNGELCATWAEPVEPVRLLDPDVVSWITAVEVVRPDVVLGYASGWDAIDRKVPGLGDTWLAPGDPVYDEFLRREYAEALDVLSSTGADVAWLSTPCTNHPDDPAAAPERTERMDEIVAPLVSGLPRHTLIDWRGYLGPCGGPRDLELRSDGDHVTPGRLAEVAGWLAPQLLVAGGTTSRPTSPTTSTTG